MINLQFKNTQEARFSTPLQALRGLQELYRTHSFNNLSGIYGDDNKTEIIAYFVGKVIKGESLESVRIEIENLLQRDIALFDYYFEKGEVQIASNDTTNIKRFDDLYKAGKINRKVSN